MREYGRSRGTARRRSTEGRNRRLLCFWLLALVMVAATFASGCSTPTLSNDPKNLFAIAEPATVLVYADVKAHVAVPGYTVNESKLFDELYSEGYTPYTAKWNSAELNLIVSNPIGYLDPDYSNQRATDGEYQWRGSGFIADPNGYVVTNAHVAAPSDDDIKSAFSQWALTKFVTDDMNRLKASGYFSASRQQQLQDALITWYAHYLTLSNIVKQFSVVMGANIAGTEVTPKQINADVVTAGEAIPGKDVAILKIEGQNYPTIPIGDDTQTNVGDKLFVIGYPGAAGEGNENISLASLTEPTFTSGVVSAKKQATEGYQVIQTDAAVTHGNSGGPVLDANGNVVGIATFGSLDQSGNEVQGFNFIMPSTLIKQFMDRSGAHPAQGTFTKLYATGLAQEQAGAYKDAKATFQQIDALSPANPYVQQHISQDESAIAGGKDKSLGIWPIVIAGVVGVIVIAGVVILLVVASRRKKPQPAAQPVGAPAFVQQAYQPQLGGQAAAPLPAAAPAPIEGATVMSEPSAGALSLLVTTPAGSRQMSVTLPCVIGRGGDSGLTLDDSEVSRHHVQIANVNGLIEVTDLGSSNGTRVNDHPINVPVVVQRGDRIGMGKSEIVLE
jgi:serine protease Do